MQATLAKRVQILKPSPTLSVTALAKQMAAQGIDVISFGAGEPDFATPEYIKAAAHQALEENFTHYTPAAGIPELRQAIALKLRNDHNLIYSPDELLVSAGAKAALANVLLAILNKNDEVLIPIPYWVSYPALVELCEAIPVYIPTDLQNNFKITAEQLENTLARLRQPKALILNSPNNPSGAVYTAEELQAIAKVCLAHEILIISDEIYEKLIYDGFTHYSIAQVAPEIKARTVIINGVSKAYAMTGWRLGWAAGPKEIIKAALIIQEHTLSCVNSITQKAAVKAYLEDDGSLAKMRNDFRARRDFLINELNQIPQVHCPRPAGAFYAFPNIADYLKNNRRGLKNSIELCEYLLQEYHVALVPGAAFGMDECVRFSYATSMENIIAGVQRFAAGLAALR
jgi:aspartate aminotransferase